MVVCGYVPNIAIISNMIVKVNPAESYQYIKLARETTRQYKAWCISQFVRGYFVLLFYFVLFYYYYCYTLLSTVPICPVNFSICCSYLVIIS